MLRRCLSRSSMGSPRTVLWSRRSPSRRSTSRPAPRPCRGFARRRRDLPRGSNSSRRETRVAYERLALCSDSQAGLAHNLSSANPNRQHSSSSLREDYALEMLGKSIDRLCIVATVRSAEFECALEPALVHRQPHELGDFPNHITGA